MSFVSYEFLFIFLPIALLGYHVLNKINNSTLSKIFLNLLSIIFCGILGIFFVIVLILSLLFNYTIASLTHRFKQKVKVLFFIGLFYDLGSYLLLLFLLATNQQVSQLAQSSFFHFPYAVPLGIGVVTLHQISFLISVCLKKTALPAFTDYTLYVSFFPQLPAGPVNSYEVMIKQYEKKYLSNITFESLAEGLYIFAIGFFKKAVLADSLVIYVINGYNIESAGFIVAWLTGISFSFQIYFELSGICDMAVGIGRMFQINIPFGFLSSYKAKGLKEFWHSFNSTVTQSIEEAVIDSQMIKKKGLIGECARIFVILMLGSFWFGLTAKILLWGVLHASLSVFENIFEPVLWKIPNAVKGFFTFIITTVLWVLFRAETFMKAGTIYKGMLIFWNPQPKQLSLFVREGNLYFPDIVNMGYFLSIFLLSAILCFFGKNSSLLSKKDTYSIPRAVLTGFLLLLGLIYSTRTVL